MDVDYVDIPRKGDHICYVTDVRKFRAHYPKWDVTYSIEDICREIAEAAAGS